MLKRLGAYPRQNGLAHARALKAAIDAIVHALESDAALPDKVAPPKATTKVNNPFG